MEVRGAMNRKLLIAIGAVVVVLGGMGIYKP
jgi:uncharacterized membrane protein YbaN (DUF454 family)